MATLLSLVIYTWKLAIAATSLSRRSRRIALFDSTNPADAVVVAVWT